MPRFDGTGPQGLGPLTGRGRGFCVMKLPNQDHPTATGIAGAGGEPFGRQTGNPGTLQQLHTDADRLDVLLRSFRRSLDRLSPRQRFH
ncbi:MAG: DUF5320 domain-containing protein [Phycisphaerae bacterium]